jgi:hypothetical protein
MILTAALARLRITTSSVPQAPQDCIMLGFSVPHCSVAVQNRLRLPLMTAGAGIDMSVDRLHHFSYSEHAQSLRQRISPSTARRIIECAIYESVCLCTTSRTTLQSRYRFLLPTTYSSDNTKKHSQGIDVLDSRYLLGEACVICHRMTPLQQVANSHNKTAYR